MSVFISSEWTQTKLVGFEEMINKTKGEIIMGLVE